MTKPKWTATKIKLGQIQAWDSNPRMSTKAQAQRIIASERKFGQPVPFLVAPEVDGRFLLYDGHQRLAAWFTVYGADYEMDAMVADRPLTEAEHKELIITLHTGATGSWNWDNLSSWSAGDLQEWGMNGDALKGWNNDANNLKELLTAEVEPVDAEPQTDRAGELAEKWQTEAGQLWKLGDHRLLIGDCTLRENVERLMGGERADMTFIDPPYNALKSWNKDEAHSATRLDPSAWFENDNMEWSEYWEFMARVFENLQGHSVYICCDFRIYDGLKPLVEAAGYKVKHCIVWKKNVWGLGKRYRFQHEFIIYACKEKAPFYGDRSQSDVWEMDIKKTTEHNTPKPVELPQKAISNSLEDGAIMFDGCCGHGTTIIAAHNLNRRCFAMEISEKYGAVILQRFLDATGIQPELVE